MTGVEELRALLERCESGGVEPDRPLDLDIAWAVLPDADRLVFDGVKHYPTIWTVKDGQLFSPLDRCEDRIEHLTSSINAAANLVRQQLPKWAVGLEPRHYDDGAVRYRSILSRSRPEDWDPDGRWIDRTADQGSSATPQRAILSALLRAKIAEAESLPGGRE